MSNRLEAKAKRQILKERFKLEGKRYSLQKTHTLVAGTGRAQREVRRDCLRAHTMVCVSGEARNTASKQFTGFEHRT